MTDQKTITLDIARKTLSFLFLSLFIIVLPLTGCTKKETKGTIPETKAIGCEVSDKLPKDIATPAEVNYGGKIVYRGTTVEKLSKNQFKISYYWMIKNDLGKNRIFVHFTDSHDNVLFQNDHDFCPNLSSEGLKGKFIKDTYLVGVPEAATQSEIDVKIGLYVPEPDGLRLKIESAGKTVVDADNTRATVDKISP